jgi:serine/threonine protein kinase
VIIKKISKQECWRKELEVLKLLSEKNTSKLLKYIDYFESQRFSYIITEFYDGLDLFEHIDINVPYSEKKAVDLILEMAKCIKECHDNNILHLDIKCENYMVKSKNLFVNGNPNIVLIDFGHAEIIPTDESIEQIKKGKRYGTNYYVCPEGYYYYIHSSKSDIWSLGVCFTLLLTGDFPYVGKKNDFYKNVANNKTTFTKEIKNPILYKLITDSLDNMPLNRPNIDSFISILESQTKLQ